MSANDSYITDLVAETAPVVYGEDNEFSVLPVNYKMAERVFLAAKGRTMNETEQEELKDAFADRAVKDHAFVDERAVEACEQHHGLIMTGTTLDDGIDSFIETVTDEVKEAFAARGIGYTYRLQTHLPSLAKLRNYIDAAQTMEA